MAPTPPPSPPRDGRRNLTEQIGHSKGKEGVECSDVAVCLGTVITARPATDLTTQSRKHSRSISGSSGHSTNFQLEGEWRLWDLGARGFRLPYSLHIDIDSGKSLHFPVKKYWQRNSPGVPAGAKRNRKTNGSGPETATADGCHSPGDSATGIHGEGPTSSASLKDLESLCQELAVVLDSRSVKISQLNNLIKSLKEQKKQVQHQLEVEKKANNEKQSRKGDRALAFLPKVQIQRLNTQKGKLNTDLYHMKRSLRYFEYESKDLAGHLQHSLQCIAELEWALSAVTATQEKKEISTSSHSKAVIEWQLEWSIWEQALLNAHMTWLKELLKQVQLERDEYAQHIKGERAWWQQRMRKMSQEVRTLKKEKKHDTHRVEKLERSLSKQKPEGIQRALLPASFLR
ncbi:golgin subfamily A member 8S-like [Macaca thibetana thibetana]|uniref:golgin subfamily A member 8S-like n=1 Tax=Macaca thibetana thibetana TaxID=257877 RepID=UPI0021BC4FB7|nr:golgin subfamily A member 8S-like [Macaca thibetana thibetana]